MRSHYDEFGLDDEEITKIYQSFAIYKIKKESASEDKHLIQAINSIDEIDESVSKLIERIREWYALYFPEMEVIRNNETYIKLISENASKDEIVKAKPEAFPNDIIDLEDDINPQDLEIMNNYAKSIHELQKTRRDGRPLACHSRQVSSRPTPRARLLTSTAEARRARTTRTPRLDTNTGCAT